MFEAGDIVQIIDVTHSWYPALLIVDEPKNWGVVAYIFIPQSNDGSKTVGTLYTRLRSEQIEKVGNANII